MSQNEPKPAGMTPKNCETTENDPQLQNWENLEFCMSFRFSNFEAKCANLGILGQKALAF